MAAKRGSAREAAKKKRAKLESKRAYIARRKRCVRELYVREGYEVRDIAAALVADETITTTDESLESAIRLVRSDVAEIRAELDGLRSADAQPNVAGNEVDALERKLERLRKEHRRQESIASGEPDEQGRDAQLTTTTDTPGGPIIVVRPKWPAGVRQKASKDACTLAEKIAEIEITLAEKRRSEEEDGTSAQDGGLTIVESDKSLQELIARNLHVN